MKEIEKIFFKYILPPIIGIITFVLGWIIPQSFVNANFNLKMAAIILVLVVMLSAIIVFALNFLFLKRRDDNSKTIFDKHNNLCDNCEQHYNKCKEKVEILSGISDRIKTHSSIINYSKLAEIEKIVPNGKVIYVFTSEFKLEEEMLKEIIKYNFSKNITYKYIIPEKALGKFKENVKEWEKDGYSNLRSLLECYVVPDNYIYMTVLAYGTNKINDYEIIIKLTGGEECAILYPYMILLNKDDYNSKRKYLEWLHTFTDNNRNGKKNKYWTELWN